MDSMRVNEIYEGDCLDVMRQFPDNCIDTILTDPPYGLSFMGKNWDHGIPGPVYWREALRVAKPGATLMAFGGTRTYHRLACAIEDAGWEIRDCITYFHDGSHAEAALMATLNDEQLAAYLELHYPNHQTSWVYGSGFPKSHNVSKGIDKSKGAEREIVGQYIPPQDDPKNKWSQNNAMYNRITGKGKLINPNGNKQEWLNITAPATPLAAKFDGWGSALKPAVENIVLAMKPMGQSYAANAEAWGVAGLWIDGGRIEASRNGDDYGRSAKRADGTISNHSWAKNGGFKSGNFQKPSSIGRYPANVILDGSETVEAEFAKAGNRLMSGRIGDSGNGQKTGLFNMGSIRQQTYFDTGTASRYFAHCPSDTEPARLHYCPKAPPSERATPGNNHPTQKPLSLMRYLARLSKTPDGGIVLDPFAGSGTTALACISEGRDYILIEKEASYADLCRRRIAEYTGHEIVPKEVKTESKEVVRQLGLW